MILQSKSKALAKCMDVSTNTRPPPFHNSQPDSTKARRPLTVRERRPNQSMILQHTDLCCTTVKDGPEVVNSFTAMWFSSISYAIRLVRQALNFTAFNLMRIYRTCNNVGFWNHGVNSC